jgi:hypothetical protein
MRTFSICVGVCLILATAFAGDAGAVGKYVVGKEACGPSSSLASPGIVPDTLNQLAEIPCWNWFSRAVDRLAGEIKAILAQFGVQTGHQWERKKVATSKRAARKAKKRRVKVPPKAR